MKKILYFTLAFVFALYSCEMNTTTDKKNETPTKQEILQNQNPKEFYESMTKAHTISQNELKDVFEIIEEKDLDRFEYTREGTFSFYETSIQLVEEMECHDDFIEFQEATLTMLESYRNIFIYQLIDLNEMNARYSSLTIDGVQEYKTLFEKAKNYEKVTCKKFEKAKNKFAKEWGL